MIFQLKRVFPSEKNLKPPTSLCKDCKVDLMELKEIVKCMTSAIENRKECLDVAVDRGLGKGMQIEKWALVEMLPKLIKLKIDGYLDKVEGEHKYIEPKNPPKQDKEKCDFWWSVNNKQHWLEVKTIVLAKEGRRGTMKEISEDLNKKERLGDGLGSTHIFHHLAIVFPIEESKKEYWKQEVKTVCKKGGLVYENDWSCNIDDKKIMLFILSTLDKDI
jgi:hypothetical protein